MNQREYVFGSTHDGREYGSNKFRRLCHTTFCTSRLIVERTQQLNVSWSRLLFSLQSFAFLSDILEPVVDVNKIVALVVQNSANDKASLPRGEKHVQPVLFLDQAQH
jgi:hypothetical protein